MRRRKESKIDCKKVIGMTNVRQSHCCGKPNIRETSNHLRKSTLKRRVLFGVLAICITLCKASAILAEENREDLNNNATVNSCHS